MGNLLGRFFGGLEIKQGVTDDHVREFFDVLACHAIGKNEGLAVAHLPGIAVHDFKAGLDVRGEVFLVDHEDVRLAYAGAALARDLVPSGHVDDVEKKSASAG